MNNSIAIHQLFVGDKAVLANFFKSELSALTHCLWQRRSVASNEDPTGKRGA
ncbi:MAG: hypothetical protein KA112_04990 [Alphaproteobacteria bacterium]|nr:hypothetical protein [Alphaproteobacteria bacterium]MBP7729945.1 hypothetical protein [Alphaproteobacteria bacterium]